MVVTESRPCNASCCSQPQYPTREVLVLTPAREPIKLLSVHTNEKCISMIALILGGPSLQWLRAWPRFPAGHAGSLRVVSGIASFALRRPGGCDLHRYLADGDYAPGVFHPDWVW